MKQFIIFLVIISTTTFNNAQVGINTTSPHPSAAMDIQSGNAGKKGFLAPRMTTTERNTISAPAESLLVFDTDLKAFYYYNTSTSAWIKLNNDVSTKRNNYKLIKTVADLSAESVGGKYVLNTNTLYEINGTLMLDKPIDLNNAYIQGIDSGEDRIVSLGNIFDGSKGGSIKGLTLSSTSGKVVNLSGTSAENLIFRDCIIANSASVGSINNFGLVFSSIIQYTGNTTGITYSNISQLLLSNVGWFGNNTGTFEKFSGTFSLLEKQGGFSEVNGTAIGFDVSDNPTISGDAVLESVVFNGTNAAGYVKKYTTGTYPGYNFNNSWNVNSPGIPKESDDVSTGDINLDAAVGSGVLTSFTGTGNGSRKKVNGTTTSNSLFRFTKDGDNRITYRGNKKRFFQVAASVSYQATEDLTLILYIAKNGVIITETKVYGKGATGFFTNAGILALPIVGTVELKTNDYIEVWAERYSGSGNIQTLSLNLNAR